MLSTLAFLALATDPFERFNSGERFLLAAPDKVILRRLDRNSPNEAQLTVLQSRTLATKAGVRQAVDALKVGLTGPATPTKCFNPRHRMILYRGKQKLSLIICFECHQYHVEGPGENPLLPFSPQAAPLFAKILKG